MLVSLLVILVLVGLVLYVIQMLPIDNTIKAIIRVLVVVFVLLWVLQSLDVWTSLGGGRLFRL